MIIIAVFATRRKFKSEYCLTLCLFASVLWQYLDFCNIFVELEHFIPFNNFDKYHNFIYHRINIKLMVHRPFMPCCKYSIFNFDEWQNTVRFMEVHILYLGKYHIWAIHCTAQFIFMATHVTGTALTISFSKPTTVSGIINLTLHWRWHAIKQQQLHAHAAHTTSRHIWWDTWTGILLQSHIYTVLWGICVSWVFGSISSINLLLLLYKDCNPLATLRVKTYDCVKYEADPSMGRWPA